MALTDLDLILNKDAILATYPSDSLKVVPDDVFQTYRTYARTHIALGDTEKYVNTIFKWVGGDNKGAFIGAVVGDYGHGKTSFQVHVWSESIEKKILAVPPFAWRNMSDVLDGTAAWVNYTLGKTHPDLARKAQRLYEQYREKSVQSLSQDLAQKMGKGVELVKEIVNQLHSEVSTLDLGTTPENILDYLSQLSELVQDAGLVGVLVLLDEPEVAAKNLGNSKVSQILFDLAEGLRQRQGNYGVFISMPENFLATVQQSFSSLTARLQERGCMPRLRDMYGRDFAKILWKKYNEVFGLGQESNAIVSEYTLQAIGQVGSSERRDLSYGPRTVISAFRAMVKHFKETKQPYAPEDFVQDCLNSNILVNLDYTSKIRETLTLASSIGIDEQGILTLSAYPNGISLEQCKVLGIAAETLEAARRERVIINQGSVYYLESLRAATNTSTDRDELEYAITDIFDEYAPSVDTFSVACDAFLNHFLPVVFEKKQSAQSLSGWEMPAAPGWSKHSGRIRFCETEGAFRLNASRFPKRKIVLIAAPLGTETIDLNSLSSDMDTPDVRISFRLRWDIETALPTRLIDIEPGVAGQSLGKIDLALDLVGNTVKHERLESIVDQEYLTPLGVLYLIGEMDKRTLSHEYAKAWETIRSILIRELHSTLLGESRIHSQAIEHTSDTRLPASPGELLSGLHQWVLIQRYPNYQTLIKQPRWIEKVDTYARILRDDAVPLSFKRGRQEWEADKDEVAHIFSTNRMNLDDFFKGYEDLIEVVVGKRDEPARVTFRIHPLEEQIKERIMEDRPSGKMKIGGKECWWIPLHDILPLFQCSGYKMEEISKVVEIGRSRKSFDTAERNGTTVLYCVPQDPEQLRAQLTTKLHDLSSQIDLLKGIPGFTINSSFVKSEVSARIQEVQDDAGYDSVLNLIHREFEKNNARIPNYRDALVEKLDNLKHKVQNLYSEFNPSQRQVASLERAVKGQSRWGADFERYIRMNLVSSVKKVQTSCSGLLQSVEVLSAKVAKSYTTLAEQIEHLRVGTMEFDQLLIEFERVAGEAKLLHSHLNEYDKWLRLLIDSDTLYDSLLKLSTDKVHEVHAKSFLGDLEKIWQQIGDHIASRNVLGLADHQQFKAQLEDLDKSRMTYQTQLRSEFEKIKNNINLRLQRCGIGAERVNEAFNPEDVHGAYGRMYELAMAKIQQALDIEYSGLQSQRYELLYARDVTGRIESSACEGILDRMAVCQQTLNLTKENVTIETIKDSFASEAKDEDIAVLAEIATAIDLARRVLGDSKVLLRESQQQAVVVRSESEALLNYVPDGGGTDLKHIILKLIEGGQNTDEVLDGALDSLVDLFKADKIRVKVELPRR